LNGWGAEPIRCSRCERTRTNCVDVELVVIGTADLHDVREQVEMSLMCVCQSFGVIGAHIQREVPAVDVGPPTPRPPAPDAAGGCTLSDAL
jgi:hypothetical protein